MSNWGQPQQPGYQYPMQTGFPGSNQQFQQQNPQFNPQQQPQFQPGNPQFQPTGNFNGAGLATQPTGFPGARPGGFQQQQQPQQSFQTGQGFLQAQPTGFPGQPGNFQQRAAPPPPVPPIPSQFQIHNAGSGFLGAQQPQQHLQQPPQINRFLSASPGIGGGGLQPQMTGFPGRPGGGGLVPQMTGFVDPRLQMMTTTFMPAANSQFGAAPQLAQPQFNLQDSIQQHNQANRGSTTQQMSWALTKSEKKQYNDIFRSWDASNTGFINGQTALEVFGASGLPKDDLAKIWSLADVNDRGKLNIAEFHVAMGLIYRKLSGNPIPDALPNELIPPSARDLDDSVDQIKNLLANETRTRSPGNLDEPISRLKNRSFNSSQNSLESGRDATIYKHSDKDEPAGGYYKPKSRHVNRDDVRSRMDADSPSADLADMKRRLASTASMLDRAAEKEAYRSQEDEELDREMDEMTYRVKRVSEDLEYVTRSGPRTPARDAEKRKLERELLELTHEKIPALERKVKAREERKEREKREWTRERDRANDRFGRFDARDDRDRDRDRPYSRGGYDRDRYESRRSPSRDRDREYDRDRGYDRDKRDYDRPRSPPRARSPPPPPPAAEPPSSIRDPPAPPKPTASPAPATKNMTVEERKAFAKAEAQRRINARMAALGVTVPSSGEASSPVIDTSVEDRLAQDKKEAEEKARLAEKQAEERERARKERLESEKAGRAVTPSPASPKPPVAAPSLAAVSPKPAAPPPKVAPAAPPKRAPPPPAPRRGPAPPAPTPRAVAPTPPKLIPPPARVEPEVDPEEEAIRAKEEALKKQREARAERLRQLEREEQEAAEAARLEEERYQERMKALRAKSSPKPPTPPPAEPPKAPSPPPAPEPPAARPTPAAIDTAPKSTNPFSRLIAKDAGATATSAPAPGPTSAPTSNGSSNPWARPAAPASPAPPASAGPRSYNVASNLNDDDDWDDVREVEVDDSSDEEDNRSKRENIARKLFGGILPSAPPAPTSRPSSAAPGATSSSPKAPHVGPTSAPPEAPPTPFAPPPPPVPPVGFPPPPFEPAPVASGGGDGRGALLASIQGGLRLKPTKTVDKSGPPGIGKVLGDTAPPAHINAAPRPASPPAPRETLPEPAPMVHEHDSVSSSVSSNRQSVGWFTERAADAGREVERLPSTTEEDEDDYVKAEAPSTVPSIMVESFASDFSSSTATEAPDMMADIDKSVEHLTRTLYAYEGDGPDDLAFGENLIVKANPSKTGGDWWYGTLINTGKSGLFPKAYVEPCTPSKAKALYSYTGNNPDELPFMEGDELNIIDKSEEEWWKAEQGGVVFIVPAAYLEAVEDSNRTPRPSDKPVAEASAAPEFVSSSTDTPKVDNMPAPKHETMKPDYAEDTDSDSDDDTDTSSSYLSFDESDDDEEETKADKEARAHERQMVLEAAGLILTKEKNPPPRPPRVGSIKRRPAPAAPEKRRKSSASMKENKDLPPVPPPLIEEPEPEPDHAQRLDDAFERYESFKQNQANRMSVASTLSMDTVASSPSNTSFANIPSPTQETKSYSNFLHNILGRSKTPEPETGRKTLTISGPISVVNMTPTTSGSKGGEEISRSPSPGFGSSWASLVDKSALEGLPSGERKRQEAIFELITTEGAYVRDLQLIVEKFYGTMLPLLSQKEITVIFANIEDILITNTTFLSVLEDRQRDCRLYIDRIGDILLDHIPNMASYMAYCVNQGNAIKVLKSLRDSNAELAVHLQRLRDDPAVRNLDLSSYLLVPMQRATRYPLLIKQILHHTGEGQEKKNIERALDISEKILEHINESIRDQEGREKLKELSQYLWIGQGRLDLTAPTRYMGPRRLLKEGALAKAKSGRKLYGFLCSDIFVLTDESMKTLYRLPIPLAHAQVTHGKDDITFEVGQAYPRGGDSIMLKALSVKECTSWMNEVEYAGRRCRHAEDRAMKKQRRNQ